jgi:multidrug resistance efflux pump
MQHAEELEPIVIPMRGPLPPPPLPAGARIGRLLRRLWPFAAWLGAAAAAAWLYTGEAWRGHALAYEDIQEVHVSPAVAGRLESLTVELGQSVRAGDLIALLDARDLEARIRLAKSEVARLRTRVNAEREALRLDEEDRRSQAQARVASYEAEGRRLRGQLDRLRTDQAADEAERIALRPQVDRLKPLVEKKLITADRLEAKVQELAVVEKRIASRADAIRAGGEEVASWTKFAPEKAPESTLEARLLPYELELRGQETKVAELELEREKYRITAPVSGAVNQILARVGEWRSAGAPIVEIVVPRPDRVMAYVTDRQVPLVGVGTRATLRPHEHGGAALEGKVVMAGPQIQQVPLRLRAIPTIPQWGRLITIQVTKPGDPLPGEIYDVRFH